MTMTERVFTTEDQLVFADLSGDYNPLHVDPVIARRLMFGRQVVHGLHGLLWSLDRYFSAQKRPLELRTVRGGFQNGIGVGLIVVDKYFSPADGRIEIKLETDTAVAAWFQIDWQPSEQPQAALLPATIPDQLDCRDRSFDEVSAAKGTLSLYLDRKSAAKLFPNLARVLPPLQLSELLATTRLVGMECPGLNSIFAGLDLSFFPDCSGAPRLNYQVSNCNRKLSLLMMDVNAPGMKGEIKAFLRPKIQQQAAFVEVESEVEPQEFSSQRALIVGGSRGLGEVTAKLLGAGGAEVTITYCAGERDARRIVAEMVSSGAKANCRQLDVLAPPQDLLGIVTNDEKPLYLYYFATPFIFGTAKGKFSQRCFRTFSDYYVTGFSRTVQKLVVPPGGLQKIFYPSTTAIEEIRLDMGEYASAKAAGEILCDYLQKAIPGIAIYKPRLPRLATDQTVSLLPVNNQEPVSVLLPHLRALRDLAPVN